MTTYDNGGDWPGCGLFQIQVRNDTSQPIPVWTAEQTRRALAWLKAHYGDETIGGFHCPSEPEEA